MDSRHGRLAHEQLKRCEAKARQLRADVLHEYVDLGVGASDRERPGLTAMLKRIGAGDVDYVIVASVDRLVRQHNYYQELQAAIERCGARLILADNGDNGMRPSDAFMHAVEEFCQSAARRERREAARRGWTTRRAKVGVKDKGVASFNT